MSLEEIQAGTFVGLFETPTEVYYPAPYVSNSYLSTALSKSFAHAEAWKKQSPEKSPAMILGERVHMAALERDRFTETFVCAPVVDRRTTAGKTLWAAFVEDNKGKIVLDEDEYNMIASIVRSIDQHPAISSYLSNGKSEQSYFWQDQDTGVMMKARADYLRHDGLIIDLKTTEAADFASFQRSVAKYGYYRQAAIYLDGLAQATGVVSDLFCLVAIEKKGPLFGINAFLLDDGAIEQGRLEYKHALKLYAEHKKRGHFPCYPPEVSMMGLPNWKINENLFGDLGT